MCNRWRVVVLVFALACVSGRLVATGTYTQSLSLGTTVWANGSITWTVGDSTTVFVLHCSGASGLYTSFKLYANGASYGPIATGQTGTYTVTNPSTMAGAQFRVYVWDNSMAGDDVWIDWELEQKIVIVSLRNTSAVPVTYRLLQDGEVIGELTLEPGQAVIQQFAVPSDSDVSVVALLPDYQWDGNVWTEVDGAITELGELATATPAAADEAEAVKVPEATGLPTETGSSDTPGGTGAGTVWSAAEDTTSENLLDKDTFKEGIDKVVLWEKAIDGHLEEISDKLDVEGDATLTEGELDDPEPEALGQDASAKASEVLDKFTAAGSDIRSTIADVVGIDLDHPVFGVDPPTDSLVIDCGNWTFGRKTVHMQWDISDAAGVIFWINRVLTWLVALLGWYAALKILRAAFAG